MSDAPQLPGTVVYDSRVDGFTGPHNQDVQIETTDANGVTWLAEYFAATDTWTIANSDGLSVDDPTAIDGEIPDSAVIIPDDPPDAINFSTFVLSLGDGPLMHADLLLA